MIKLRDGRGNWRGWRDTGNGYPVLQANHPHKWLIIAELAFERVNGAGHAIAGLWLPGAGLAGEGDCHAHDPIIGVGWDGGDGGNLGIVEIPPKLSRLVTALD